MYDIIAATVIIWMIFNTFLLFPLFLVFDDKNSMSEFSKKQRIVLYVLFLPYTLLYAVLINPLKWFWNKLS